MYLSTIHSPATADSLVGTVQDDGPTPLAAGLVPAVAGFTQSEKRWSHSFCSSQNGAADRSNPVSIGD